MFIQFQSDNNISATDEMVKPLNELIEHGLKRFEHQVSSIHVHLTDVNASKGGDNDKRCVLEARLDGMDPVAVTAFGDTIQQSVRAAIDKMKAALDTRRDRLKTH